MEIQTTLILKHQPISKKITKKFNRLSKNRQAGADDGTMKRSGDIWKPVNQTRNINNQ